MDLKKILLKYITKKYYLKNFQILIKKKYYIINSGKY